MSKQKRNRKAKLLPIIFALVLMVAFSGCSSTQSGASTEPPSSTAEPEGAGGQAAPGDGESMDAPSGESLPEEENVSTASGEQAQEELDAEIAAMTLYQYQAPYPGQPIATIKTELGDIKIMLFPEQCPKAVENFITHAKNGYYDGLVFHRTMSDFMIQGGDPLGNGMGGESIYTDASGNPISFEDEFDMSLRHFRGALSMANSGPNTNGSQFFIVQANRFPDSSTVEDLTNGGWPLDFAEAYINDGGTPHLDGMHTVFGQVIEGMDVVDAIAALPADPQSGMAEKPVTMQTVTIEEYAG